MCFCKSGFGRIFLFTANLNVEKMLSVYGKCLLTSVKKFLDDDTNEQSLQEDNDDPKHRRCFWVQWKDKNNITTMDWSVLSADANPIENVQFCLKFKLRGKPVFILKQLTTEIRKLWRSLPREYRENLVESMDRRCQAIIDNGGDWSFH